MAIKPYPAEWEKRDRDRRMSATSCMRPIRPEDERAVRRLPRHVTPDDLRLRLFAPQKELSHKFLARLTQIDYAREMAFVAIAQASGELLGVARFAADPDYAAGRVCRHRALRLQGRGLGWLLMRHLIDYAKATGIARAVRLGARREHDDARRCAASWAST